MEVATDAGADDAGTKMVDGDGVAKEDINGWESEKTDCPAKDSDSPEHEDDDEDEDDEEVEAEKFV